MTVGKKLTTNSDCHGLLRKFGYVSGTVEQWIAAVKIRRDFCGFADIIAFRPLMGNDLKTFGLSALGPPWMMDGDKIDFRGCLAVQGCSADRLSDHIEKLTEGEPADAVRAWLESGNRLEIWGWSLKSKVRGQRGGRKKRLPTIARITYEYAKNRGKKYSQGEFFRSDVSELSLLGYVGQEEPELTSPSKGRR